MFVGKKGNKFHLNPDVGEKSNCFWFITSQESAVGAGKVGNQSVISDVIEGEMASALFLKIRLGSWSPPWDVHSYITDIKHIVREGRDVAAQQNRQRGFKLKVTFLFVRGLKRAHAATVGAADSAIISAVPTFPLSHKKVSLCSRFEKKREDGKSLITLYLLTFPLPPRREQRAALIPTHKLLDRKEGRRNSICLAQARPR